MSRNASGDSRQTPDNSTHTTVQLELNGSTWELDQHEQASVEALLAELRAGQQHEPWCDPQQHATAAADGFDDGHCVGRIIETSDDVGGWWTLDSAVGNLPRFYVDGSRWYASQAGLTAVQQLLQAGRAEQLLELATRALADFENGIPAGEQA